MNIYQARILEAHNQPHFKGEIPSAHRHQSQNISCGDDVTIYLELDELGVVTDIKFSGEGCIISQAAAEILCEEVVSKNRKQILAMDWEDMVELLGIELTSSRIKCASLALDAVQKAIHKHTPKTEQV